MILFKLFASTMVFMTRSVHGAFGLGSAFGQSNNPGLRPTGGTNPCNPPRVGIERPNWEPPVQIPNGPPVIRQANRWL